ncbi:MAG: alpha/beta hydrolase [Gemmatimonas sp.]|jgi:predicted esterase|uniref:alpha/beta hydrolase n=1 Tax=Gemmatimonas sp. TaxID=1962908 RepID=UPI00391FC207|nr:esterase [Gemmatimonadota bacterium]
MSLDITTHRVTVSRTARYATTGAAAAHTNSLWVAFHGYGQRAADFIAPFADAAPPGVRIIAPEGLSRFYLELPRPDGGHLTRTGATWLTRDDREDELRDALAMLHAVVGREIGAVTAACGTEPTLHLLGFSQGVAMSMRYVVERTAVVAPASPVTTHVLWAGGLAHDVADEALRLAWRQTAVHLVRGERDRFADDATRAATQARFVDLGQAVSTHTFAGGHRLDTPLLRALLAHTAGAGDGAVPTTHLADTAVRRHAWPPPS